MAFRFEKEVRAAGTNGNGGPKAREDREPPRIVTRLHMPAPRIGVCRFRVVAELVDGRRALVCIGPTQAAALDRARGLARSHQLSADVVDLILQVWTGTVSCGAWQDAPVRVLGRDRARRE